MKRWLIYRWGSIRRRRANTDVRASHLIGLRAPHVRWAILTNNAVACRAGYSR